MTRFRNLHLILCLWLLPFALTAQIIDDSTHQVYNFKSVGFRTEKQFFLNDTTLTHPDSLLTDFERTGTIEMADWFYQDLGNDGTASRPIFFQVRNSSETQAGFRAFDLYRRPHDDIAYYNTRSPYTKMSYLQSNRGVANLRFLQSQNIKPNWNVTLDVDRTSSSRQINQSTNREERLVNGWNVILNSNYTSKNQRYTLLTYLNHLNFEQTEQGGIVFGGDERFFPLDSVYLFDSRLKNANSRTYKNTVYAFQQLKLANGFDVYNRLSFEKNSYGYSDISLKDNSDSTFYDFFSSKPDSVVWRNHHYVVQNTVGLKGYYKQFLVDAYIKQRFQNLQKPDTLRKYNTFIRKNELIFGGGMTFSAWDSLAVLTSRFEVNGANGLIVNGKIVLQQLTGRLDFATTPPDLLMQKWPLAYFGWESGFNSQSALSINADYLYRRNNIQLQPLFSYLFVDNYFYYDNAARPAQLSDNSINSISVGAFLAFDLPKMYFENRFLYTTTNNDKVYPIPPVTNNTLLYFKLRYARVLHLRLGVENFYKSKYYAPAYNPVIQQFYLQEKQQVWGYNFTDLFLSFNVKKVKLAIKLSHVNDFQFVKNFRALFIQNPSQTNVTTLITTPDYPGMRNNFLIKIDWPLFD